MLAVTWLEVFGLLIAVVALAGLLLICGIIIAALAGKRIGGE